MWFSDWPILQGLFDLQPVKFQSHCCLSWTDRRWVSYLTMNSNRSVIIPWRFIQSNLPVPPTARHQSCTNKQRVSGDLGLLLVYGIRDKRRFRYHWRENTHLERKHATTTSLLRTSAPRILLELLDPHVPRSAYRIDSQTLYSLLLQSHVLVLPYFCLPGRYSNCIVHRFI